MVATIEKLLSSWKDFKNYFKYKRNEIRIKDFILRLRIKDDTKLSKRRINSSSVLKANVVKQVVKFHNKNQKKLVVKDKRIAKKINDKCFICNKIAHATKYCMNKGKQGIPTKRIARANINEVDHLTNKVSKINLSCVVSKANLINNLE